MTSHERIMDLCSLNVRRIQRYSHLLLVVSVAIVQFQLVSATISSSGDLSSSSPSHTFSIRLPGSRYEDEWDFDDTNCQSWKGSGREFSIFDSRGGSSRNEADDDDSLPDDVRTREMLQRYRRSRLTSTRTTPRFRTHDSRPEIFQTVQTWWSDSVVPNLERMPKIVCRVEPTTTLKLRKTFRPLKTIIRLGADFNTQLGVWQFQSSWEDAIIGGKLTLAGKELQLTKSWQLSVGAVEDLVTRLRFRAAINLQTFQAYARVGFRTERLSPINVMEGFTILKRLPLDGSRGNVKLEVKANIALPEPELEYSTETQRSLIGNMGDVEVSIDELNLLLDY
jgi:hypothetical protein